MFNALVDTRLSIQVGEPDEAERSRISAQLNGAVQSRLGNILGDGPFDVETIDSVAPWARDLARGLHWQAMRHTDAFDPQAMIEGLTADSLDPTLLAEGASTVATTWALTLDRVVEQIRDNQARERYSPRALFELEPWQHSVLLGYGIHIVLEWLRLDPRLGRHAT